MKLHKLGRLFWARFESFRTRRSNQSTGRAKIETTYQLSTGRRALLNLADFYAKIEFLMREFRVKLLIMLMLARYLMMIPHLFLLVVLSIIDAEH